MNSRPFLALAGSASLLLAGCHSIHSESVRRLIDREEEKIAEIVAQSANFGDYATGYASAINTAMDNLDEAKSILRGEQARQALIYNANTNVETKTGSDALAISYLFGLTYINSYAGLDESFRTEINANTASMTNAFQALAAGWTALQADHATIAAFARRTGVASIDPALIGAAITEFEQGQEIARQALKQGEKLLAAIDASSIERSAARSFFEDVVTLLRDAQPTDKPVEPVPDAPK